MLINMIIDQKTELSSILWGGPFGRKPL